MSLFKKINYRGVAMVEYAVLLSFICVVAGVYFSVNGIDYGIDQQVNKIVALLDGNNNPAKKEVNIMKDNINVYAGECTKGSSGIRDSAPWQMTFRTNEDGLYLLDPSSTYDFTIDTSKAEGIAFTGADAYGFTMQLFTNNSDGTHYSLLDSASNTLAPSAGQSALSLYDNGFVYYDSPSNAYTASDGTKIYATSSGSIITYRINTGDKSISLGGNVVHNNTSGIPESQKQNVSDFIKQGFSLIKVG